LKVTKNRKDGEAVQEKEMKKFLRYEFSEAELQEFSKALAREVQDMASLEHAKKEAVTGYAAQIEARKCEVAKLARNISNRHEYRNIDCVVEFHKPNTGWKTVARKDTGEVVEEIAMTTAEMQEQLPFDPKQQAETDAKANGATVA
jgi:hypothetical protein